MTRTFFYKVENDEGEVFEGEHECSDFGTFQEWLNSEFPDHWIVSMEEVFPG